MSAREGIVFRETPERDLTLDRYAPVDAEGPLATFVYVHGGGWADRNPDEFRHGLRRMAVRGFACVNLTYRVTGEATYPAAVADVAWGVGWARERLDAVDPGRIALGGLSAGAHLATLVAAAGEQFLPADAPADPTVRAAVGLSGTYDLAWWGEETPADVPRARFLGGTPDELPDRYAAASPVTYVADAPPTLLAHGTDDEVLPIADAAAYRDALRAAGRHVEFLAIDGGGHLFPFDEPGLSTTVDAVARFLRSRL